MVEENKRCPVCGKKMEYEIVGEQEVNQCKRCYYVEPIINPIDSNPPPLPPANQ